MRFGHYWDHWECGFRYSRPMSSWSTLHSILGLAVDLPGKSLTLRPTVPYTDATPLAVPLCTPNGLGQVRFTASECIIACTEGTFTLSTLHLPHGNWIAVNVDGKAVDATIASEQNGVRIVFVEELSVGAGGKLTISVN